MSDKKYTPKGITKLPWALETFDGLQHCRIQPSEEIADGGSLADVYCNSANGRYMVLATKEYPAAIDALRHAYASLERAIYQFEGGLLAEEIRGVLSRSAELEDK